MAFLGYGILRDMERGNIYAADQERLEKNANAFCAVFNAGEKELFAARNSGEPAVQN
jgi:hypothetical protein